MSNSTPRGPYLKREDLKKSLGSSVTRNVVYPVKLDVDQKSPVPSRFPSDHPIRKYPEYRVRELMRMNPLVLFFAGFIPPFIGAISSIIVALVFHNDEISNYNWQCGVMHFKIKDDFSIRISSIDIFIANN